MKVHLTRFMRTLFFILLALLWIAPGVVLSHEDVVDGFLYQPLALAEVSISTGRMDAVSLYGFNFAFLNSFLGYPMILAMLLELVGISPETLAFAPIGGPVLALCAYAVTRQISKSSLFASAFSVYAAFEVNLATNYSVFAYSWTYPLYLLFLFLLFGEARKSDPERVIALFLLFVGAFLLHYAVPLWMLTTGFFLAVFANNPLRRNLSRTRTRTGSMGWNLLLAIGATYVGFNRVFYNQWIPDLKRAFIFTESLSDLASILTSVVLGGGSPAGKYAAFSRYGDAIGLVRVAEYVVIMAPLLAAVIPITINRIRRTQSPKEVPVNPTRRFALAIVLTAFADMLTYAVHGWVSVKFITFALPLASLALIERTALMRLFRYSFPIAIVVVAVMGFSIAASYVVTHQATSLSEAQPGAEWFISNTNEGAKVLTDLDTSGRLLLFGSKRLKLPTPLYFDEPTYLATLGQTAPGTTALAQTNFVIIDVKSGRSGNAMHGIADRLFEPITKYSALIDANPGLSSIYSDGIQTIYAWDG